MRELMGQAGSGTLKGDTAKPRQPTSRGACRELSEDELCLVSLAATEGLGPASLSKLQQASGRRRVSLCTIVSLSAAELEAEVGLTAQAARTVAAMADPGRAARSLVQRLKRLGGRVLLAGWPGYPSRLRQSPVTHAPAVLFVMGDSSLLQRPCLAVVGSRQPSRAATEAARFLAANQAAGGTTVVSGGARGIDRTAHRAAAESGATAIVPPVGLERFRWTGLGSSVRHGGAWCAAGQFPPQSGWRAAHALMRNRTIVALSDAVVAFEPRDTGGTWHTCITTLGARKPLFIVAASRDGAKGRGLKRLVRMGAVALDPLRMPHSAAFARLVSDYRPPPGIGQLPLFNVGAA